MSYTREQIEAAVKAKGYKWFEDVNDKGYDVNIVGIRNNETKGRVTNARDEEHLSNLIKLYKQMGGKGVKEGVNEQSWHKDFKGYSDKELKVISKFIMLNDKGIDGVIKMSKKKDFKPLIKKMAQKGLHEGLDDLKALPKDLKKSIKKKRFY